MRRILLLASSQMYVCVVTVLFLELVIAVHPQCSLARVLDLQRLPGQPGDWRCHLCCCRPSSGEIGTETRNLLVIHPLDLSCVGGR